MRIRCTGVNQRTLTMNCKNGAHAIYQAPGSAEWRPLCATHANSGWARACGFRPILPANAKTMEQVAKHLLTRSS